MHKSSYWSYYSSVLRTVGCHSGQGVALIKWFDLKFIQQIYVMSQKSYLLNKEQPPNCNYCKSLLTVEHILTSCSAYKNIREKHYSNSQLSHIFTNISKQHIFNYLWELNFKKTNFSYGMI